MLMSQFEALLKKELFVEWIFSWLEASFSEFIIYRSHRSLRIASVVGREKLCISSAGGKKIECQMSWRAICVVADFDLEKTFHKKNEHEASNLLGYPPTDLQMLKNCLQSDIRKTASDRKKINTMASPQ